MIVVVRINQCMRAGGTVPGCAYRAWRLGRLLIDHTYRNRFKYLVALNGRNVEGVFCINAVAPDPIPGKVQFSLTPVNSDCFNTIENIIDNLYGPCNLNKLMGSRYLDTDDFNAAGIQIPEITCCPQENIPLIGADQIEQFERPQRL